MHSLRLRNFRCLKDTGDVEIKPLTILLGENSAGKSTFLRVFPLFRQTFESRTRSPFLWYGRLVDFGEFDDVLLAREGKKEIAVEIGSKIDGECLRLFKGSIYSYYFELNLEEEEEETVLKQVEYNVSSVISKDASKDITFTKKVIINLLGYNIEIAFEVDGSVEKLIVNGEEYEDFFENKCKKVVGNWIPSVNYKTSSKAFESFIFYGEVLPELLEKVRDLVYKRYSSEQEIANILRNISIDKDDEMLKQFKTTLKNKVKTSVCNVKDLKIDNEIYKNLRNLMILNVLPNLIFSINKDISSFSGTIKYIDPLRATANRYYRFQDLAVDEIDSRGQNLPMFIHALPDKDLRKFQKWTKQYFGFHVEKEKRSGHLSLILVESNFRTKNLADSGFGFSQILPIVTQLWWQMEQSGRILSRKQRKWGKNSILVMEQPELHLHPKMQAMISDGFVAAVNTAKENKKSLKIIVETHSESIINRVGELISEGKISAKDVNVVLFERDTAEVPTTVRSVEFDEDGYLRNWPHGFFSSKR